MVLPAGPEGAVVVPVGPVGLWWSLQTPGGAWSWALLGDMGPAGLANKHPELRYETEPVPFSTFTQMAACMKYSLFGAGKQLFGCF